jgi:hypothetical protein
MTPLGTIESLSSTKAPIVADSGYNAAAEVNAWLRQQPDANESTDDSMALSVTSP